MLLIAARRCFLLVSTAFLVLFAAGTATAQTATVARNVNLRPAQSTVEPAIRLLTPSEPPLQLIEPYVLDGYYHVRTAAGEEGYVWSRNVKVTTTGAPTPATPGAVPPPAPPPAPTTSIHLGAGVPGSASMVGCGDARWEHVYNPTRLTVKQDCITVTGTIVDATATESHHQPDGVRHEGDGDTHGWLKVDPEFSSLLNAGNTSNEGGNLVFELVCHFPVTQADAKPACNGFPGRALRQPPWRHFDPPRESA